MTAEELMSILVENQTEAIYVPSIKGNRVCVEVAYADIKKLKQLKKIKGFSIDSEPIEYWGKKRVAISLPLPEEITEEKLQALREYYGD